MHESRIEEARLVIPFPPGIPSYAPSHGYWEWDRRDAPLLLLHHNYDIFWIRTGQARLNFSDGRRLVAGPDEFIIKPPFVPGWLSETRRPLSYWYCHFTFRPVPDVIIGAKRQDFLGPPRGTLMPLIFSRKEAPGVGSAYRRLSNIDLERGRYVWQIERAVLDVAAELAHFAMTRRPCGSDKLFAQASLMDERVAEVQYRIERNPAYPWSVGELSEGVDLSQAHLNRLYRAAMGKSLKRVIVESRLHNALRLLKDRPSGRLPTIKEVSIACGFSSQHFFSRQFKSYFQIGPLAYRAGGEPNVKQPRAE